ncbi:hypothetical protein [Haloferula sp. BvORR071]|uniref:DUF6962 family protein n=1 Tax=Haloferula sp. BvORR071 TaxID=1396141 RepID=UPI000553C936|nr:hypothetical protein [Haloferula sp. BvORR071]
MTLFEPATFVTDLLLAVLGMVFVFLLRKDESAGDAKRWWIRAMALMASSALLGGCYHGFAPNFQPAVDAIWWRLVLIVICGLGFAMGMSLLCELRREGERRGWKLLLGCKLGVAVLVVTLRPEFVVAMADYGSAMLACLVAAIVCRRPWSVAMIAGVALSIAAGVAQQGQWGLSPRFNHNDVFHLIQAMALFAFYRGGKHLSSSQG